MTNDKDSNDTRRSKTDDYLGNDSAAAPSTVDTNTVICDHSKSDCSQTDRDDESDPNFTKGQTVCYTSAQGVAEEALILEVHVDDLLVPYYTIRLLNSDKEKQTDGARISTLSDLCKSTKSNVIENVQSPTTPSRPLRSILRPSSYGRNRRITPATSICEDDDRYTISPSSKIFLQSIEKKLSERKAREKRAAQVVTPDSDYQTNHQLNMTPKQLIYTRTRKRKRADDDDAMDATRVRKKRRLAIMEEESSTTGEALLPFYFMPRSSMLSSSTWDINNNPRNYPEMVPNVPIDWPINGGGYYPISFHDKHSRRDQSRSIEFQMFLFDEILTKLENDAAEERAKTGTSMPSRLSPVATFLSSFSTKYVSNAWGYIRSKLVFGGASVKQAVEVIPSDPPAGVASGQASSKAAAVDVAPLSSSTSALHTNVTRKEKSFTSSTQQQMHSPPNMTTKPLLPRPPDRWQDAFAIKAGHWKCKTCFHQNPSEAMTCDVCTALRVDRRFSDDAQSSDTQSIDAQTNDDQSSYAQSEGSQTEVSGDGDSYTDDDTYTTTSDAETDDDTLTTNDTDPDGCQTSCSSVKPTEDNPNSPKATKDEDSNASPAPNVTGNNEGRRRSSLALAVERIRADRATNAAFHAQFTATEQPSLSDDESSAANRIKRFRRGRSVPLVDDSIGAGTETGMAGTVADELDVVDLDLAPFLEPPLDTDVESMSVTSNMSFVERVDRSEMMELDGALFNKRGSNDFTAYGKKQRFG
mmetsp:Transcript_26240/g.44672  ORF Transcript_26240/g.44672 Transcript_26240/m.44672 type:complete len:752 (-) Transcript_26240:119-2374(-)